MAEPDMAVALRYAPDRQELPRVVAKGRGQIARQILAQAEAYGVPVRRDQDLAQLLSVVEIDSPIPLPAFAAVAEILALLYRANAALAEGRGSG
jgi:flagellar biosynthesis protein